MKKIIKSVLVFTVLAFAFFLALQKAKAVYFIYLPKDKNIPSPQINLSCIPASGNVSGCQLKNSYSRQCTREYYQKLGQQCNPARTGMSLFNWYSCTCFYKETFYNCGGVTKAAYAPLYVPAANGYSSFSYYNYAPTCLNNSVGLNNGGGIFTNKSQCAAWCANR